MPAIDHDYIRAEARGMNDAELYRQTVAVLRASVNGRVDDVDRAWRNALEAEFDGRGQRRRYAEAVDEVNAEVRKARGRGQEG
jgi:hypothetical protein